MQKNGLYRRRGFFFNYFFNATFVDFLDFKARKLMVGYDEKELNANLELQTEPGSYKEWALRQALATVSYDLKEKGLFGLQVDLSPDSLKKDRVSQLLTFGYRNKLSKDLEFKTKISLKKESSFFLNYRIAQGLSFQSTLTTSLVHKHRLGFLGYPFDLSLKLKLER